MDDAGTPTTVARIRRLELVDPHFLAAASFVECDSITNEVPCCLHTMTVNDSIQRLLSCNDDDDIDLLSPVMVLYDLDTSSELPGSLRMTHATCTDPPSGSCWRNEDLTCAPDPGEDTDVATYSFQEEGTCLSPVEGATDWDGFNTPVGPCIVSDPAPLTVRIGLIGSGATVLYDLPLQDAQMAAEVVMDDGGHLHLENGLMIGFLPESVADGIPSAGGLTLSDHLPGSSCFCDLGFDGRDQEGCEMGWWFHFNFEADDTITANGF
ncbi:MAG: hypothetical protein ACOCV4_03055 [Myxococcota bacterium]